MQMRTFVDAADLDEYGYTYTSSNANTQTSTSSNGAGNNAAPTMQYDYYFPVPLRKRAGLHPRVEEGVGRMNPKKKKRKSKKSKTQLLPGKTWAKQVQYK